MLAIPSTLLAERRGSQFVTHSVKSLDSVFNNQTESRWWGHLNHYLKKAHKTGPSNIQGDTFERMSTVHRDDEAWIVNILEAENKIPSGSMIDSKEIWFLNPPQILILIKSTFGWGLHLSIYEKSWLLCSSSSVLNMSFSFVAVTSHSEKLASWCELNFSWWCCFILAFAGFCFLFSLPWGKGGI